MWNWPTKLWVLLVKMQTVPQLKKPVVEGRES